MTGLCIAGDIIFVVARFPSAHDIFRNALLFMISRALHTLLHELGHLLGGLFSGYRLCAFSWGPVRMVNAAGRLQIRFRLAPQNAASCVMIPPENATAFLLYNLGGALMNAAVCVCAFAGAFARPKTVACFWLQMFFAGLLKVIANAIPSLRNGCPNDALTARILRGSEEAFADYKLYLALYEELANGGAPDGNRFARHRAGSGLALIYWREMQRLLREHEAAGAERSGSPAAPGPSPQR